MKIKAALFCLLPFLISCTQVTTVSSSLEGKQFPQVIGESLDKQEVKLPDHVRGKPAVLLIAYKQRTQFDVDRWILGLLQAEVPVAIVEVPTIAGMLPNMVSNYINEGMRSGIPEEDWATVVTVYDDAAKIVELLGNERPQSTQVVLLNKEGTIMWHSNRGYSASQVLEIKKLVGRQSS
jgi:hypothetical protein